MDDRDIEYELCVIRQQIDILEDTLMQLTKTVEEFSILKSIVISLTEDINKLAEDVKMIEQNQRQEADDRY